MHISKDGVSLLWPELTKGVLMKRYKRFLADVLLDSNRTVTAHCANSGSMKGCCDAGRNVFLSYHDNPKRKLKYTWQLIDMPNSLVGVNTLVPNRLVAHAVRSSQVPALTGYKRLSTEVKVGDHTRLDLMLESGKTDRCYVEIKNCTLVDNGVAMFPDAVTTRGLKHIHELVKLAAKGDRVVMFFLIQRMDANLFTPADDIDPQYGKMLRKAFQSGLEILVYDVLMDRKQIRLNRRLPCRL